MYAASFLYFHRGINDEKFRQYELIPGQRFEVSFVETQAEAETQDNNSVGPQIISLIWEQARNEMPFDKWCILPVELDGRLCGIKRRKDGEWDLNMVRFENGWEGCFFYNGLKKLDTDLAENRWKDMIKYDQENASRKSASCVSRH